MSDEPPLAPATATARRVPRLLVVALGLLLGPGAGHFAIGKQTRGIAIAAGYIALMAAANFVFASSPSVPTLLLIALAPLLQIASLIDLVRIPKSELTQAKLHAFVAAVVIAWVAKLGAERAVASELVLRFRSPSSSMAPTMSENDQLLLSKRLGPPKLGSVVVIPAPEHPEWQGAAKRVLGVGGDRVERRGNRLWINGREIPVCVLGPVEVDGETSELAIERLGEPHLIFRDLNAPEGELLSWQVAPGEIVIVGDNRKDSADSAIWSSIRESEVVGQAVFFVLRNQQYALQEIRRMELPKGAEHLRDRVQPCLTELAAAP